jgi:hypothetical protein
MDVKERELEHDPDALADEGEPWERCETTLVLGRIGLVPPIAAG